MGFNIRAFGVGLAGMAALWGVGSGKLGFGERPTRASAEEIAAARERPASRRDGTVDVRTGDPEMEAAIAKARASLPDFWAATGKPAAGVGNFSLKVAIPYGGDGSNEHFWLGDIERKGGRFLGTIANEPNHARHVKAGQRYEFGEADISDWMFMRGGRIVGNETMRPLLKRMPPQQAAQYRAMLETP